MANTTITTPTITTTTTTISRVFEKPKINEFNEMITCELCEGYLIDPTVVDLCGHTFCKSCIIKHLQQNIYCPQCGHYSKPLNIGNLRCDTTLRSFIYRLVPGLFTAEINRRKDFKRYMLEEKRLDDFESDEIEGDDDFYQKNYFYSSDDPISLSLEYHPILMKTFAENDKPPPYFLKCPAGIQMKHLKHFLRSKYGIDIQCINADVDIMYDDEILRDEFSLIDVCYCYDYDQESPLRFTYRIVPLSKLNHEESLDESQNQKTAKDDEKTSDDKGGGGGGCGNQTGRVMGQNQQANKKNAIQKVQKSVSFSNETITIPLTNYGTDDESNEMDHDNDYKMDSVKSQNNASGSGTMKMIIARRPSIDGKKGVGSLKKSNMIIANEEVATIANAPSTAARSDFKSLRSNDIRYCNNFSADVTSTKATAKTVAATLANANSNNAVKGVVASSATSNMSSKQAKSLQKSMPKVSLSKAPTPEVPIVVSIPQSRLVGASMDDIYDNMSLAQLKTASKKSASASIKTSNNNPFIFVDDDDDEKSETPKKKCKLKLSIPKPKSNQNLLDSEEAGSSHLSRERQKKAKLKHRRQHSEEANPPYFNAVDLETYAKHIGLKPINVQTATSTTGANNTEGNLDSTTTPPVKYSPSASPMSSTSSIISSSSSSSGTYGLPDVTSNNSNNLSFQSFDLLQSANTFPSSSSSSSHKKHKKKHSKNKDSKEAKESKRRKLHAEISAQPLDDSLKIKITKISSSAPSKLQKSGGSENAVNKATLVSTPATSINSNSTVTTTLSNSRKLTQVPLHLSSSVLKSSIPTVSEASPDHQVTSTVPATITSTSAFNKLPEVNALKPKSSIKQTDLQNTNIRVIESKTVKFEEMPKTYKEQAKIGSLQTKTISSPLPPSLFKTTPSIFPTTLAKTTTATSAAAVTMGNQFTAKSTTLSSSFQQKPQTSQQQRANTMKTLSPMPQRILPKTTTTTPSTMAPHFAKFHQSFAVPHTPRPKLLNTPASIASAAHKQAQLKRSAPANESSAHWVTQPKVQRFDKDFYVRRAPNASTLSPLPGSSQTLQSKALPQIQPKPEKTKSTPIPTSATQQPIVWDLTKYYASPGTNLINAAQYSTQNKKAATGGVEASTPLNAAISNAVAGSHKFPINYSNFPLAPNLLNSGQSGGAISQANPRPRQIAPIAAAVPLGLPRYQHLWTTQGLEIMRVIPGQSTSSLDMYTPGAPLNASGPSKNGANNLMMGPPPVSTTIMKKPKKPAPLSPPTLATIKAINNTSKQPNIAATAVVTTTTTTTTALTTAAKTLGSLASKTYGGLELTRATGSTSYGSPTSAINLSDAVSLTSIPRTSPKSDANKRKEINASNLREFRRVSRDGNFTNLTAGDTGKDKSSTNDSPTPKSPLGNSLEAALNKMRQNITSCTVPLASSMASSGLGKNADTLPKFTMSNNSSKVSTNNTAMPSLTNSNSNKSQSDDLQNLHLLSESATARDKIGLKLKIAGSNAHTALYEKPKMQSATMMHNASVRNIPNPSALAFRNQQPLMTQTSTDTLSTSTSATDSTSSTPDSSGSSPSAHTKSIESKSTQSDTPVATTTSKEMVSKDETITTKTPTTSVESPSITVTASSSKSPLAESISSVFSPSFKSPTHTPFNSQPRLGKKMTSIDQVAANLNIRAAAAEASAAKAAAEAVASKVSGECEDSRQIIPEVDIAVVPKTSVENEVQPKADSTTELKKEIKETGSIEKSNIIGDKPKVTEVLEIVPVPKTATEKEIIPKEITKDSELTKSDSSADTPKAPLEKSNAITGEEVNSTTKSEESKVNEEIDKNEVFAETPSKPQPKCSDLVEPVVVLKEESAEVAENSENTKSEMSIENNRNVATEMSQSKEAKPTTAVEVETKPRVIEDLQNKEATPSPSKTEEIATATITEKVDVEEQTATEIAIDATAKTATTTIGTTVATTITSAKPETESSIATQREDSKSPTHQIIEPSPVVVVMNNSENSSSNNNNVDTTENNENNELDNCNNNDENDKNHNNNNNCSSNKKAKCNESFTNKHSNDNNNSNTNTMDNDNNNNNNNNNNMSNNSNNNNNNNDNNTNTNNGVDENVINNNKNNKNKENNNTDCLKATITSTKTTPEPITDASTAISTTTAATTTTTATETTKSDTELKVTTTEAMSQTTSTTLTTTASTTTTTPAATKEAVTTKTSTLKIDDADVTSISTAIKEPTATVTTTIPEATLTTTTTTTTTTITSAPAVVHSVAVPQDKILSKECKSPIIAEGNA